MEMCAIQLFSQSINQSIDESINQPINKSINLSNHPLTERGSNQPFMRYKPNWNEQSGTLVCGKRLRRGYMTALRRLTFRARFDHISPCAFMTALRSLTFKARFDRISLRALFFFFFWRASFLLPS
jgi:hypothetical protein